MKFKCDLQDVARSDADTNSDVSSEYEDQIKENDGTLIKSPSIKLCLYNSED